MSQPQVTADSEGIQYIFAYFIPAEADREMGVGRWYIPRHRFQLANPNSNRTMGQFITSNWWSRTRPIGERREYLILGIRGGFNYTDITSLINGALSSRGHNQLTEVERMHHIVIKEHFVFPANWTATWAATRGSNRGSSNVHFTSDNMTMRLTLSVRDLDGSLYICLPNFQKVQNVGELLH